MLVAHSMGSIVAYDVLKDRRTLCRPGDIPLRHGGFAVGPRRTQDGHRGPAARAGVRGAVEQLLRPQGPGGELGHLSLRQL